MFPLRNSSIYPIRISYSGIPHPTHETATDNKRYVDNKKPVITLWATVKGSSIFSSQIGSIGLHMRVDATGDEQAGYIRPVSCRILFGSLGINGDNVSLDPILRLM